MFPTNFRPRRVYFETDPDDAACARRCLDGDPGAFEPLVRRYERVLFNVALRLLGDAEDAVDATQACFVKAYEHLGTYDARYRFFSWIYRILANECLNARRSRRASEDVAPDLAAPAGADSVVAADRRRAVHRALLAIPAEYREVIVLRHYADLSYAEIASTLGIREKTVKSRLYTARQRLGELLLDWAPGERRATPGRRMAVR